MRQLPRSAWGGAALYRNLGPSALGSALTVAQPTYVLSTTNDLTKDVWIKLASQTGTVGSRTAAEFNPYYDTANIFFNRNDATVSSSKTSNRLDTFCATCHANFHGGPGDTNIGASPAVLNGFVRHPTSQVSIGASASAGFTGHSSLSRFLANTTKIRVYVTDYSGYTNATPGCVTCHKAHGNQNPFGLVFLNRNAVVITEEGGIASGQAPDLTTRYRNLCGQCHSQGA
jgi:hypothetical protein